jgi:hypothetical protein
MASLTGRAKGNSWATGVAVFAGAMLIMIGFSQALLGIAALVNDTFLVGVRGYIFAFDPTVWGWIHLLLGLGLAVVGWFIFQAKPWALWAGIGIAALNGVLNLLWLPVSPIWAVVLIAIDVVIVWALVTTGRSESM